MIDESIFGLTQNAGLAAVIGTRLFPQPPTGVPQRTQFPAITYQRISAVQQFTHPVHGVGSPPAGGSPQGRAKIQRSRFQFNIYGRTVLESRAATDALIAALDEFTGGKIEAMDGPRDLADPDSKTVFPSLDVIMWHQ